MTLKKKIRFILRFLVAVVTKQQRIIFLGGLLGVISFFIYPRILKFLPRFPRTQKIGMVGQFSLEDLPKEVLAEVSFGLTRVSEKGDIMANIAQSWVATDEGKTFIVRVPERKLIWHDGNEFSLNDINYNFKDVTFSVGNQELIFKLNEPYSPFPNILSKPLFRKGLIGLGNFKIKKIVRKNKKIESILLVPHNSNVSLNKLYRFYDHEEELKIAFNLGEVDILKEIFDLSGLTLGPKVTIQEKLLKNVYLAVFFNTRLPLFAEKTLRQALAYAVPKKTGEKRAIGPLNPSSWANNPDVKPYNYDLDHSLKLLANGKIKYQNQKIIISTFPQYEQVATLLKESWQKLEIESQINIQTFIPEDFEVLIAARKIPEDPDQYYFWHSTQTGNLTGFKSPRIDKLLEDGRKVLDKEERKNIYFDFQRFLAEESPAIFLTHPTAYMVTRD